MGGGRPAARLRGGDRRDLPRLPRWPRGRGPGDPELFAWHALDAPAPRPCGAGAPTPAFVYGFDDFDPLQLDALDTLANRCEVDVWSRSPLRRPHRVQDALPAPPGPARTVGGGRVLPPLDHHYAPSSRAAAARHRAQPLRGRRRAGRAGVASSPFRGRTAPGDRARRRAGARPAARRHGAGRHRGGGAPARRLRVAARAVLRRLRHPVTRSTAPCASATLGWVAACSRWCAVPPTRMPRPPPTCSPGCARRVC